jgi:UDP-GlcNAc:undecaprenyl-phosphate/decaprenyl-phosphate GlcNAc-1-phosphate transferase
VPFLVAWLTLPLWSRWCVRNGLVDEPGRRKIHDQVIPLSGGLAVSTALIGSMAVAFLAVQLGFSSGSAELSLEHGFSRRVWQLGAIGAGAVGITLLGIFDDRHELRPLAKFAGQLVIALLVAFAGVRITLFVANPVFSFGVTVLWVLTLINALNFMDNMNGLCAGCGAIGAFFFGVLAAVAGQYLVAAMAFLITGALAGFLPHNFPEARAFLGDAGSHLVGYLLAVLAILPHFYFPKSQRPLAVLTPLLVLALPLADLVRVVVVRTTNRKPFYIGDTNHLSHWMVRLGLSKTTAVMLIWLAAALCGCLAICLNG